MGFILILLCTIYLHEITMCRLFRYNFPWCMGIACSCVVLSVTVLVCLCLFHGHFYPSTVSVFVIHVNSQGFLLKRRVAATAWILSNFSHEILAVINLVPLFHILDLSLLFRYGKATPAFFLCLSGCYLLVFHCFHLQELTHYICSWLLDFRFPPFLFSLRCCL